jgi:dolichyl-phosphate-mannose-protein mannosyltransferase
VAPANVSPPPVPADHSLVSREEKIEYRDQDGNLLNEEQVKALEGKVSFKTRYETRTRLVDAQGKEINSPGEAGGVAPPHPDVEGVDRETIAIAEPKAQEKPAVRNDVKADESKDDSVARSAAGAAKPASEGNEATSA